MQPLHSPARKTARRSLVVLLITTGLPRFGRWFRAASVTIVQGMLAGIGVVLVVDRLHALVDADTTAPADGLERLGGVATLLVDAITSPGMPPAVAVGIGTTAVLVLWPRRRRAARAVPAPLVAVALATAVVTALRLPMDRIRVRGLLDVVQPPGSGGLARLGEFGVLGTVLACALAATAARGRLRIWPVAAAALLPWVLDLVPVAALAAALVHAGWKLRHEERGKVAVLLMTTGTIVMTGLFDGVVVGLLTAVARASWEASRVQIKRNGTKRGSGTGICSCPWPAPLGPATPAPVRGMPQPAAAKPSSARPVP